MGGDWRCEKCCDSEEEVKWKRWRHQSGESEGGKVRKKIKL